MNELTLRDKAVNTHARIMTNGQVLQNTLLEICKDLKSMRDERLYKELGYETFEEYAEKAVGLKQRQAYSYISTYEKLGPKYLEENSSLGITKLELISQIDSYEREEFIAEENVESMSVRELKEKVDEYKKQNEQLTFQLEELSQSPKEVIPDETVSKENEELKAKLKNLPKNCQTLKKKQKRQPKLLTKMKLKSKFLKLSRNIKKNSKRKKPALTKKSKMLSTKLKRKAPIKSIPCSRKTKSCKGKRLQLKLSLMKLRKKQRLPALILRSQCLRSISTNFRTQAIHLLSCFPSFLKPILRLSASLSRQ